MQHTTKQEEQVLLASLLQDSRVPPEELLKRHPGVMKLVSRVVHVIPLGTSYLETWPPAFEAHNLLFPAAMNLPAMMFGFGASKQLVLLCGYASARFDGCSYMAAHFLGEAARSGVSLEKLSNVLRKPEGLYSPAERSALAVVEQLSQPSPALTKDALTQLKKHVNCKHIEWIAATTFFSGFMDKLVDAIAVELEQQVADVAAGAIACDGWEPGVHGWLLDPGSQAQPLPKRQSKLSALRLLPFFPGAAAYENKCTRGVPARWPKCKDLLEQITGHAFPLLGRVQNVRLRRAVATVIAHGFDPATSVTGLHIKSLLTVMFVELHPCEELQSAATDLCQKFQVRSEDLQHTKAFVRRSNTDANACGFSNKQMSALLHLGRAVCSSPCMVTTEIVQNLNYSNVAPSVIVELVSWVAVLQMLSRMFAFLRLL